MKKIIHIGFPKTGTTSLQKGYFSKHPDIIYRGQTYLSDELRKIVEIDILTKSEFEYDRERVISKFKKEMAMLQNTEQEKVFLFSHEAFTYRSEGFSTDMAEIARRIHDIFGESKILISIRRQDEILHSLYQQAVKGGCYINFDSYLDYYMGIYFMSFFPLLKYIPLIKYYEKLFGKNNVLILCFEEMKDNPEKYFSALSDFCNIRNVNIKLEHENKGFGKTGVLLQRIANKIVSFDLGRPQLHHSLRRSGEKQRLSFRVLYKTYTTLLNQKIDSLVPFSDKISIPSEWKTKIVRLYKDTNIQLLDEYNLPLKRYEYPGV